MVHHENANLEQIMIIRRLKEASSWENYVHMKSKTSEKSVSTPCCYHQVCYFSVRDYIVEKPNLYQIEKLPY